MLATYLCVAEEDHNRENSKRENNLKLNSMTMKLRLTDVPFISHVLTVEGVKIDPVTKMPEPQNVKELMCFIGMVQYLSQFLPRLSDVMEPLRQLTDKDAQWQ